MSEATVVTSENAAEFYAKKMNQAPANAPAEAVETTEPVVEKTSGEESSKSEEKAIEAGEAPKPNPKIEKRFSELTFKQKEAERQAEAANKRAEEAERKAAELEAKLNPPKPVDTNAKPLPSQFTDAFEYAEALAEWSAENALNARDKQEAEKKEQAEKAKVYDAWRERTATFEATHPDYQEMLASSDVSVSDAVRDAIVESEYGPHILYHLAENPEIAKALASKTVASAVREIGKLEALFGVEKPTTPLAKVIEPASKISRAPAPIAPLRGANVSADVPIDSNGDFHGSYAQWKAARNAGKIR